MIINKRNYIFCDEMILCDYRIILESLSTLIMCSNRYKKRE